MGYWWELSLILFFWCLLNQNKSLWKSGNWWNDYLLKYQRCQKNLFWTTNSSLGKNLICLSAQETSSTKYEMCLFNIIVLNCMFFYQHLLIDFCEIGGVVFSVFHVHSITPECCKISICCFLSFSLRKGLNAWSSRVTQGAFKRTSI